jgi:hypothetical protein
MPERGIKFKSRSAGEKADSNSAGISLRKQMKREKNKENTTAYFFHRSYFLTSSLKI